ncbi:MAG: exodeoxyribonuclease V subunit gamma [Planctomycetota bacterium]|nr:exodeoxyribonuclease V subunit gamma [Planctomycetota bacterium]
MTVKSIADLFDRLKHGYITSPEALEEKIREYRRAAPAAGYRDRLDVLLAAAFRAYIAALRDMGAEDPTDRVLALSGPRPRRPALVPERLKLLVVEGFYDLTEAQARAVATLARSANRTLVCIDWPDLSSPVAAVAAGMAEALREAGLPPPESGEPGRGRRKARRGAPPEAERSGTKGAAPPPDRTCPRRGESSRTRLVEAVFGTAPASDRPLPRPPDRRPDRSSAAWLDRMADRSPNAPADPMAAPPTEGGCAGSAEATGIELLEAEDRRDEVRAIARRIRALRESEPSLAPSDIAVIFPDLDAYAHLVEEIFEEYAIGFHICRGRPAASLPVVRSLMSLLRAAALGFRREDMLEVAACPLFDFRAAGVPLEGATARLLRTIAVEADLRGGGSFESAWLRPIEAILRVRLAAAERADEAVRRGEMTHEEADRARAAPGALEALIEVLRKLRDLLAPFADGARLEPHEHALRIADLFEKLRIGERIAELASGVPAGLAGEPAAAHTAEPDASPGARPVAGPAGQLAGRAFGRPPSEPEGKTGTGPGAETNARPGRKSGAEPARETDAGPAGKSSAAMDGRPPAAPDPETIARRRLGLDIVAGCAAEAAAACAAAGRERQMSFPEFLEVVEDILASRRYVPEGWNPDGVQVLGMLDARGLTFRRMFFGGLTEDAVPGAEAARFFPPIPGAPGIPARDISRPLEGRFLFAYYALNGTDGCVLSRPRNVGDSPVPPCVYVASLARFLPAGGCGGSGGDRRSGIRMADGAGCGSGRLAGKELEGRRSDGPRVGADRYQADDERSGPAGHPGTPGAAANGGAAGALEASATEREVLDAAAGAAKAVIASGAPVESADISPLKVAVAAGLSGEVRGMLRAMSVYARRSCPADLSPYTGHLSQGARGAALELALRVSRDGNGRRRPRRSVSASFLESYASCPARFFFENVAGLAADPEIEWDVSPVNRGKLIHTVLRRFAERRVARGEWFAGKEGEEGSALRELEDELKKALAELDFSDDPFVEAFREGLLDLSDTRQPSGALADFVIGEMEAAGNATWRMAPELLEVMWSVQAPTDIAEALGDVELQNGLRLAARVDRCDAPLRADAEGGMVACGGAGVRSGFGSGGGPGADFGGGSDEASDAGLGGASGRSPDGGSGHESGGPDGRRSGSTSRDPGAGAPGRRGRKAPGSGTPPPTAVIAEALKLSGPPPPKTVAIYDYKTGGRTPTVAGMLSGLEFQLPFYLLVARLKGLDPCAAAVYKIRPWEKIRRTSFVWMKDDAPGLLGAKLARRHLDLRGENLAHSFLEETKKRIRAILGAIAAGHFPPAPARAEECRGCSFARVCGMGGREADIRRRALARILGQAIYSPKPFRADR